MNGYADTQLNIVKQIQNGRRAEAAAYRLATSAGPRRPRQPDDGLVVKGAWLLVTIVLVAVGMGGAIGALTLLAGPVPVEHPTPDLTEYLAKSGGSAMTCQLLPPRRQ